jgi:transcriptional regulator with XRE-family HTH domain
MPIHMTVAELLSDIGEQVRRARFARDLRIDDLAKSASVSRSAIRNLESGSGCTLATLIRVVKALDLTEWLLCLSPDPGVTPMQLLKAKGRPRQRVRLPLDSNGPDDN